VAWITIAVMMFFCFAMFIRLFAKVALGAKNMMEPPESDGREY